MRLAAPIFMLLTAFTLEAQLTITTPGVPPGSYAGYSVPANWATVAVERDARTSLVYFSVNGYIPGTSIHPGQVFFNVRTCTASPCYSPSWQYATSIPVLTFPNASVAVGDILYDAHQPFFNVHNGQFYSYLMYIIVQPLGCDGSVAGFLAVSFSNDGVNWWSDPNLQNRLARRMGGPTFPCLNATNTIPVIAFSAVLDTANGIINAVGMEGDASLLFDPQNYATTQTYLGQATTSDPTTFVVLGALSGTNLIQPNASSCSSYKYFLSVGTAYEPASGRFYVTRDYPYPHDVYWPLGAAGPPTPCMSNCPTGILAYTNRAQTYSMAIGSLNNVAGLLTGAWQLVNDVGAARGYPTRQGGCTGTGDCVEAPLIAPQQNVGMWAGPLTIRRKGDGTMAYTPGYGASSMEFELIGTSSYDATCSSPETAADTQPRVILQGTTFGPKYQGYLDYVNCSTRVQGWAWDASNPASTVSVEIYDGAALLGSYSANIYRGDLQAAGIGDGRHAFDVTLPAWTAGTNHLLHAKVAATTVELSSSPRSVTCPTGTIQVVSGTYGENCGVPTGNVTSQLVALCNGQTNCNYTVRYQILGDPAPGCAKNYLATWRCGNNPIVRVSSAPPEAGYGSVVSLACN